MSDKINIRNHPMPGTPEFDKWSRAKTLANDTDGKGLTSAADNSRFVERLDALDDVDQESAHSQADDILLEALRANGAGEVADAWELARDRVGFWYA